MVEQCACVFTIFTSNRTAKRVRLDEFEKSSRARRGLLLLREVKTNPYKVIKTFITDNKGYIGIKRGTNIDFIKNTEIPIADRYKTGTTIFKEDVDDLFIPKDLEEETKIENNQEEIEVLDTEKKQEIKHHQVSLLEIDDRLKEIEQFLK